MANKLIWQGDRIVVETPQLSAVVEPRNGGKVRSLKSRASGWEFFFQDHHVVPSDIDFSAHDMSGMDECFPTITPGRIHHAGGAEVSMGDHGLLWNKPWKADSQENN